MKLIEKRYQFDAETILGWNKELEDMIEKMGDVNARLTRITFELGEQRTILQEIQDRPLPMRGDYHCISPVDYTGDIVNLQQRILSLPTNDQHRRVKAAIRIQQETLTEQQCLILQNQVAIEACLSKADAIATIDTRINANLPGIKSYVD